MVNVIGLGYIGLPTALMMASHGVEVVGTNHSQGKVDMLKAGKTTFKPEFKGQLTASGFYIFRNSIDGHTWKLVVDAGQPGPKYRITISFMEEPDAGSDGEKQFSKR